MTKGQERQWARLYHLGYRPVIRGILTDGSVGVAVVSKLEHKVLPLLITPAGDLKTDRHRAQLHTTTR